MSVYREEEDEMTWPSVSTAAGHANAFNDTMARLAMPTGQEDWSWRVPSSSSLLLPSEQSFCITEPISGITGIAAVGANAYYASHGPGMPITTAQWPTDLCSHEHYTQVPYQQGVLSLDASAGALRPVISEDHSPLPDVFASIKGPQHPPPDAKGNAQPQRKNKRSKDDMYTPQWVRHSGTQREGWCVWCSQWFTLRDSTYWYHMHYSHGISQVDGKRLPAPAGFKAFGDSSEWEVKCGKCHRWMPLPQGERWNTAYFRHTYKCYFKSGGRASETPPAPATNVFTPTQRL